MIQRRSRWLSAPTRAAGLPRSGARVLLALIALPSLAAAFVVTPAANLSDALSIALIDGVRHGGGFYDVARDTPTSANQAAVPLPTLALLTAAVPLRIAIIIFGMLCMAILAAWHKRLGPAFTGAGGFTLALVLVTAGLPVLLGPGAVDVPEAWAGLAIAAALARWRPARPLEGCCWAVAAAALSPAALALPLVMLAGAAMQYRRAEVLAWGAALAVGGALWWLHCHALGTIGVSAGALADGIAPFGTSLAAYAASSGLGLLPLTLAGPLLVLATFGWMIWRDTLGPRVATLIAAVFILVALTGRTQLALLVAPLWLAGLAFAHDGLRDLLTRSLDRRRMIVTGFAS